jgi:hypothetical protein
MTRGRKVDPLIERHIFLLSLSSPDIIIIEVAAE